VLGLGLGFALGLGLGLGLWLGLELRLQLGLGLRLGLGLGLHHDTLKTSVTILFILGELGLGEMRQNQISRAVGPKAFE